VKELGRENGRRGEGKGMGQRGRSALQFRELESSVSNGVN